MTASGFLYNEYYLYSQKAYESASTGVSYCALDHAVTQNAPIVVTSSGNETTTAQDPWARIGGSGKYTKVGFGDFTLTPAGVYDTSLDEFALHPDSSGKLVFNKTLTENVFIEYEAGPSGYYTLDTIDIHPARGEIREGGFIHYSTISSPDALYLATSQSSLWADGYRRAELTATLYDANYDRVAEAPIVFEIQDVGDYTELGYFESADGTVQAADGSGYPIEVIKDTDSGGIARIKYLATKYNTGVQNIKAYYQDASGIYDIVQILQYYSTSEPFVLDRSLLDMLDYLT